MEVLQQLRSWYSVLLPTLEALQQNRSLESGGSGTVKVMGQRRCCFTWGPGTFEVLQYWRSWEKWRSWISAFALTVEVQQQWTFSANRGPAKVWLLRKWISYNVEGLALVNALRHWRSWKSWFAWTVKVLQKWRSCISGGVWKKWRCCHTIGPATVNIMRQRIFNDSGAPATVGFLYQ